MTLMQEVANIDVEAADVKSSDMLKSLFKRIDEENLPAEEARKFKQVAIAFAHPYKLSPQATTQFAEVIQSMDANNDKIATGREIADGTLNNIDYAVKSLMNPSKDEQADFMQFTAKVKSVLWAEACVLGGGEKKTFKEIFGVEPGPIEGGYRDLWTFESLRQNILTRHALLHKGDMQNFARLPPNVANALPQFIDMPSGKDICGALKRNVLDSDPNNEVVRAADEHLGADVIRAKMHSAVEELSSKINPKKDETRILLDIELSTSGALGSPDTPSQGKPSRSTNNAKT